MKKIIENDTLVLFKFVKNHLMGSKRSSPSPDELAIRVIKLMNKEIDKVSVKASYEKGLKEYEEREKGRKK